MKKLYQGLTIIATAALMACSSMEINEAEALAENYPADFDAAVYLELHPVLMTMQILDYVKAENDLFKKNQSAEDYSAKYSEDSSAFINDTATLHKLYVGKRYAAYSETSWDSLWIDKYKTRDDTTFVTEVVEVVLDSLDSAGKAGGSVKILVDSTVQDTAGNILEVFGKTDTSETELTHFVVDGVALKVKAKGVTLATVDTIVVPVTDTIPAGLDSTQKNIVIYNIYGVKNDLQVLDKLPSDTEAAARQFVAFGRDHGWAYRRCKADELNNAAVDPVYHPVVYPATKLYCDDNGVAREIK